LPDPADDDNVTEPPEQKVVGPPGVMVGVEGVELTVPLAATLRVVAHCEVQATLPDGLPDADAAKRTNTAELPTVPLLGVKDTLGPYAPPDEVLTSNPVGAVTTRSAVRLVPLTLND
jgi:hypothetical protein